MYHLDDPHMGVHVHVYDLDDDRRHPEGFDERTYDAVNKGYKPEGFLEEGYVATEWDALSNKAFDKAWSKEKKDAAPCTIGQHGPMRKREKKKAE